jgi:hypothetical protein
MMFNCITKVTLPACIGNLAFPNNIFCANFCSGNHFNSFQAGWQLVLNFLSSPLPVLSLPGEKGENTAHLLGKKKAFFLPVVSTCTGFAPFNVQG